MDDGQIIKKRAQKRMREYDSSNNMWSHTWFEVAYSAAFSISCFQTKSFNEIPKILYFQVEWLITHSTVFAWSLQTASPKRPELSPQWLFACAWTPWRPHYFEWWLHRDWNSRFYFQPLPNSCIDDCLFWSVGPDPTAPRITQPRVYFCAFTILLGIASVEYLSQLS